MSTLLKELQFTLDHMVIEGIEQNYDGIKSTIVVSFISQAGNMKTTLEIPYRGLVSPEELNKVKNQYFNIKVSTGE